MYLKPYSYNVKSWNTVRMASSQKILAPSQKIACQTTTSTAGILEIPVPPPSPPPPPPKQKKKKKGEGVSDIYVYVLQYDCFLHLCLAVCWHIF